MSMLGRSLLCGVGVCISSTDGVCAARVFWRDKNFFEFLDLTFNMYTCTKCNFSAELEAYYQHIKKWHPSQTFECGQFGCIRQYDCVRTLKRHLKTHIHTPTNELCINEPNKNDFDGQPVITSPQFDIEDNPPKSSNKKINPFAEVEHKYKKFVLSLYGDPGLDRKRAECFSKNTSQIVQDILHTIKTSTESMVLPEKKDEYLYLLTSLETAFGCLVTEKQCKSYLRKENCYKDPILFTIDESVVDTVQNRKLTLAAKKSTVARMNITFIFKNFFELPGIFDACKTNMERLESENNSNISNIIQGNAWKQRKN